MICFRYTSLQSTYGYTEAATNKHPRTFACRLDYTVYWLLVAFIQASSGTTVIEDQVACGSCALGHGVWTTYTGLTPSALEYTYYGQWYSAPAVRASGFGSNSPTGMQDMVMPSDAAGLATILCPT